MDEDVEEIAAPVPQAAEMRAPAEDHPAPEPVVLSDAMCGAFCSIKAEPRQA
jgi:hypothetical protein